MFGLQVEGEELAVRIKTGRKPVKANKEWRYSLRSEKRKKKEKNYIRVSIGHHVLVDCITYNQLEAAVMILQETT